MFPTKTAAGLALGAGLLSTSCDAQQTVPTNLPDKPNLIIILADDLGYSDLGCYGGEISTPNLDKLAAQGLQFSRYRTSAMCVTTRAALLTGMEYNMAGKQKMDRGIPLARALSAGGYQTIISGKWHEDGSPTDARMGFANFFGFLGGQTGYFQGGPDWIKDGKPFTGFGPDFYATDAFTDYAIERAGAALDAKKPFFLYLSFNAPHVPLQAPEAEVRKYLDRGVYQNGWNPIRRQRTAALIERGLVDAAMPVTLPGAEVEPWELISPEQRENETLKEATYAAMIDRLDQNVGKLVAALEKRGALDNTLIVFASDNGADYEGIKAKPGTLPWDHNASGPRSHLTGSNGWAYANNAPFYRYKHSTNEGGLASPLIVHWPRGVRVAAGTLLHQNVRVWDIYPTLLDAAGLDYNPQKEAGVRPLMGASLAPIFADARAPGHEEFISSYIFTRGLVSGKWKLTSFETSPWQLFDLEKDRAETTDLAAREPAVMATLIAKWNDYVRAAGNVDPEWDPAVGERKYWMDQRIYRTLSSVTPKISEPAAPLDTPLVLQFAGDIVFRDAKSVGMNGKIYLMKYGQQKPIWSVDPTPGNCVDARTLRFTIPRLEPNSHYYLLWDEDVVRVQMGDKIQPLPPLTNGAYQWRFKTAAH